MSSELSKWRVFWAGFMKLVWRRRSIANPEIMYEGLIEEFRQRGAKQQESLGGLKAQFNIQAAKLAGAKVLLVKSERNLRAAVAANNKELGLAYSQERENNQQVVATLQGVVDKLTEQYKMGVLQGRKIKADFEARVIKNKSNLVRLRSAQAARAALAMFDTMSTDDLAENFTMVDEAIEEEIGKAEAVQDVAGQSVERLKIEAAGEQLAAEDEWAKLRAEHERAQGVTATESAPAAPPSSGGKVA